MKFTGKEERDFYSEAVEFLKSIGKNTESDKMYLISGDTSIICNPKTRFQRLLGYSINQIGEYIAKKQGKEIEWLD